MSQDILNKLRDAEIIPQVIPEDQASTIKSAIKIVYPNVTASLGEKPARRDVLEVPEIEFPEAVSYLDRDLAMDNVESWLIPLTTGPHA